MSRFSVGMLVVFYTRLNFVNTTELKTRPDQRPNCSSCMAQLFIRFVQIDDSLSATCSL